MFVNLFFKRVKGNPILQMPAGFQSVILLSVFIAFSNLYGQSNPFPLPDGFPRMEVTGHTQNPEGYYFFNNFHLSVSPDSAWLMILDTTGFPIYYKMLHGFYSNFTLQPETGTLTYFSRVDTLFHEMDSSYTEINTYSAKNGFITDGHELLLKADGSYWILGQDIRIVDMSVLVEGGNPEAHVIGMTIQHIDANDSVLFEWNTWNHFDIFDADTTIVNFTNPKIDYAHCNALDIVDDTTILLSSRAMNEITKINTNTGDIIWRWGGKHNEFTCLNDTVPFLTQHHIRYLGNENYSLFDNGNLALRPWSRALVYNMDEVNKTTTVIHDFRRGEADFSRVMGSNQLLPNGNYQVGWSFNNQRNAVSEFNDSGTIVFEMRSVDTLALISYRALKFEWETNIFDFDRDTLDFEAPVVLGDSAVMQLSVTNKQPTDLVLNESYVTDSSFRLVTPLPIIISSGETITVDVSFSPDSSKYYSAVLSLLNSNDSTRFGKQVRLTGSGEFTGIASHSATQHQLTLYPNPAKDILFVKMSNKGSTIKAITVYDLAGRSVLTQEGINKHSLCNMNVSLLQSGTYIIKVQYSGGVEVARLMVQ